MTWHNFRALGHGAVIFALFALVLAAQVGRFVNNVKWWNETKEEE